MTGILDPQHKSLLNSNKVISPLILDKTSWDHSGCIKRSQLYYRYFATALFSGPVSGRLKPAEDIRHGNQSNYKMGLPWR